MYLWKEIFPVELSASKSGARSPSLRLFCEILWSVLESVLESVFEADLESVFEADLEPVLAADLEPVLEDFFLIFFSILIS